MLEVLIYFLYASNLFPRIYKDQLWFLVTMILDDDSLSNQGPLNSSRKGCRDVTLLLIVRQSWLYNSSRTKKEKDWLFLHNIDPQCIWVSIHIKENSKKTSYSYFTSQLSRTTLRIELNVDFNAKIEWVGVVNMSFRLFKKKT